MEFVFLEHELPILLAWCPAINAVLSFTTTQSVSVGWLCCVAGKHTQVQFSNRNNPNIHQTKSGLFTQGILSIKMNRNTEVKYKRVDTVWFSLIWNSATGKTHLECQKADQWLPGTKRWKKNWLQNYTGNIWGNKTVLYPCCGGNCMVYMKQEGNGQGTTSKSMT